MNTAKQNNNYTQVYMDYYLSENTASSDKNIFYNGPGQLEDSSTLFDLRQLFEQFRDALFSTWMNLEQLQDLPATSNNRELYEELDIMNLTFFNAWIQFRRL